MRASTYRMVVIGSLFSSFLAGMHVPALHEIIEHGANIHWGVPIATMILFVASVAGGWALLRQATRAH